MRKGCLKSCTPSPNPEVAGARPTLQQQLLRKCVVFSPDGAEQIHIADEWDRTPTEPAGKLSYQEMLEFNAIQRSLPLANQPPDPYTGRPAKQYCSNVPLGLLPLLPDTHNNPNYSPTTTWSPSASTATSPISPTSPSSSAPPPSTEFGFRTSSSERSSNTTAAAGSYFPPVPMNNTPIQSPQPKRNWHPPDLAHLPTRSSLLAAAAGSGRGAKPKPRNKNFSFLPLLDTPPSTPISSAPTSCTVSPVIPDSTESTPALTDTDTSSADNTSSCASSCNSSPGMSALQDPDSNHNPNNSWCRPGGGQHAGTLNLRSLRLEAIPSPVLAPPSPFCLDRTTPTSRYGAFLSRTGGGGADQEVLAATSPLQRRKKKSIIVVNDMEIEIDEDEDEDIEPAVTTSAGKGEGEVGAEATLKKSDSTEPKVVHGTEPISIPRHPSSHSHSYSHSHSSSSGSRQRSSSISSTSTVASSLFAHSTSCDEDNTDNDKAIHSPLTSPASSVSSSPVRSPSSSPIVKTAFRPGCSPIRCSTTAASANVGGQRKKPLLVPLA